MVPPPVAPPEAPLPCWVGKALRVRSTSPHPHPPQDPSSCTATAFCASHNCALEKSITLRFSHCVCKGFGSGNAKSVGHSPVRASAPYPCYKGFCALLDSTVGAAKQKKRELRGNKKDHRVLRFPTNTFSSIILWRRDEGILCCGLKRWKILSLRSARLARVRSGKDKLRMKRYAGCCTRGGVYNQDENDEVVKPTNVLLSLH